MHSFRDVWGNITGPFQTDLNINVFLLAFVSVVLPPPGIIRCELRLLNDFMFTNQVVNKHKPTHLHSLLSEKKMIFFHNEIKMYLR